MFVETMHVEVMHVEVMHVAVINVEDIVRKIVREVIKLLVVDGKIIIVHHTVHRTVHHIVIHIVQGTM